MERIAEVSADGDMDERGGGGSETVTAVSLIVFLLLSAGADGGVEDATVFFFFGFSGQLQRIMNRKMRGKITRGRISGRGRAFLRQIRAG